MSQRLVHDCDRCGKAPPAVGEVGHVVFGYPREPNEPEAGGQRWDLCLACACAILRRLLDGKRRAEVTAVIQAGKEPRR